MDTHLPEGCLADEHQALIAKLKEDLGVRQGTLSVKPASTGQWE